MKKRLITISEREGDDLVRRPYGVGVHRSSAN